MHKIKVGIAGYGVIGQRLADGVARQEDMELVGIVDIKPTLSIRALFERGMPYPLYVTESKYREDFERINIPISGTFDDLLDQVDIMLDATPGGVGLLNKEKYLKKNVKAIFQGGESNNIAEVFFHGNANFDSGIGKNYLKLTSCNTTGLIRAIHALDTNFDIHRVALTIVRRVADPGDYHRGLTNALEIEEAPSHQAVDLMNIMPHINATGILIHTPVTHGHIITVLASGRVKITKQMALDAFENQARIRVVRKKDGFLGNASFFRYARDLGNERGDMYEIGVWEESIVESGDDIMFAINIPQESVTIPETIDAIRASMKMNENGIEATSTTDQFLGIGKFKGIFD